MKAANTRNYFVRNINVEASHDVPQSMTKFLKLDQNLRSLATTVGNEDAYLAVNKLLLSIKERAGYKLDSEVLTQFRSLNLIFHNMKNVLLRNTSQNNSRQHVMTNEFIEKELKIYKNLVIQFKEYYEEKQEDPEGEMIREQSIITMQRILKKQASIKWGILRTATTGLKEEILEESDE